MKLLTLFATALGSALAFLDTTIVIVALPQMEEDMGLGLTGQQWVYLAYALSLSAFYLVGGAIGDRVGLRRTFVVGVVLFAGASLLTALAPNEGVLIGGRAFQGVGGAVLTTTSLALLRVTWAGQAGRAIGLWTSLTSLATVGGPPLGGVIVQTVLLALGLPDQRAARGRDDRARLAGRGENERTAGRSTLDLVGSALVAVALARHQLRARRAAGARARSRCCRSSLVGIVALARPRGLDAAGAAIPSCRRRCCACPASRPRTSSRS